MIPETTSTDANASAMSVSFLPNESRGDDVRGKSDAFSAAGPMAPAMRTIELVAAEEDTRAATSTLVHALAAYFVGASVRCGIGSSTRIKRVYDHRLQWVGPESDLFTQLSRGWEHHETQIATCTVTDLGIMLVLPDPNSDNRLVVWIEGQGVKATSRQWVVGCLPALSAVLWQQRTNWWRKAFKRLGLSTTVCLASVMCLMILIAVWPAKYRVSCNVVVRPTQQRLIAAPFEATLLTTEFKPGDEVHRGQVLVTFDGRPLRLELASIEAEMQQHAKEQDVALATGKIAEAQQAELKHRQLSRQADLIRHRLTQLQVVSPTDGIVVSGDLDQHIGSPLTTGQSIAEVAALDKMVIEVEIPDFEIGFVEAGTNAKVKINGIGGRSLWTELSDIYPSAEIRDDKNVFVGRVEVDNADRRFRPGMRGEATALGPRRPLIWSYIRGGCERVLWWMGY